MQLALRVGIVVRQQNPEVVREPLFRKYGPEGTIRNLTAFEFLSVALSFVLGLAVTLLLTSLLAAFRARRTTRMDWLPFVWAGFVLTYQFQYWWAIFELSALPEWSVATFGVLLLLAVILFIAGGVILPSGATEYPADLSDYFLQDGRWGVVAIACYGIAGALGNLVLFETPLVSRLNAVQAGLVLVALLVAGSSNRTVQVGGTLVFGVLLGIGVTLATPGAY